MTARLPAQAVVRRDLDGGRFEPPSRDVLFDGVSVRGVDFSGLRLRRLAARDSTFADCTFERLALEHGPLGLPPRSVFRDCRFDRADLRGVEPGHSRFERCSFKGIGIEGWFAYCAEFVDCTFAGDVVGCTFSGRPLECGDGFLGLFRTKRLEFRGNDFSRANLVDTSFVRGIDLDAQRLPEGGGYMRLRDARRRLEAALATAAEWPNEAARREVTASLRALAPEAEEQDDLLVRRDDFASLPEDLRRELWALLGE